MHNIFWKFPNDWDYIMTVRVYRGIRVIDYMYFIPNCNILETWQIFRGVFNFVQLIHSWFGKNKNGKCMYTPWRRLLKGTIWSGLSEYRTLEFTLNHGAGSQNVSFA